MMRRTEARARGETLDEAMPFFQPDASVLLTIAGTRFQDQAAAVSALETMVGRLAEGVTVESEDTEVTFQSKYEEFVFGPWARAAWSTGLSQLSVAAGQTLFHLSVEVGEMSQEDRALAEALAREVVAAL